MVRKVNWKVMIQDGQWAINLNHGGRDPQTKEDNLLKITVSLNIFSVYNV